MEDEERGNLHQPSCGTREGTAGTTRRALQQLCAPKPCCERRSEQGWDGWGGELAPHCCVQQQGREREQSWKRMALLQVIRKISAQHHYRVSTVRPVVVPELELLVVGSDITVQYLHW